MTVTVLFHLDALDDGTVAWWAESPDVPGFTAKAEKLFDLSVLARHAIADLFAEQGIEITRFVERLVPTPVETEGDFLTPPTLEGDDIPRRPPASVGPDALVAVN